MKPSSSCRLTRTGAFSAVLASFAAYWSGSVQAATCPWAGGSSGATWDTTAGKRPVPRADLGTVPGYQVGVLSMATTGDGGVAGNLGRAASVATNILFYDRRTSGDKRICASGTPSTNRGFTIGGDVIKLEKNKTEP